MIAGRPLCRRGSAAEARGNPPAGWAGPYEINIPNADRFIRLSLGLRLLLRFLLLAFQLRLNLLNPVLLGLNVSLVGGQLGLVGRNLVLILLKLLGLFVYQTLYRALLRLRLILQGKKICVLRLQLFLALCNLILDFAVSGQLLPVVGRNLLDILLPD